MSSAELRGGALLDEGHWLDLMQWLFGMPTALYARIEKISDLEISSDDNVDMLLEYPDGLRISIHLDLYGPLLRTKAGQELKLAPACAYTMGSPRREAGRRANESQRSVELQRRYYVATREVTNAEYRQFRPQHRSGFVLQTTLELDRQPVVNVSWQEAAAYCNWLSSQEGLAPAYVMKNGAHVPAVPATNG